MLFGGFFNEYPYRDTENINLDWLLKNYKKILDDVTALKAWREEHMSDYEEAMRRLAAVENEIATFEAEITKRFEDEKAAIEADFEALTTEIRKELADTKAEIEADFDAALAEFTRLYNALKNDVETSLANMKAEINALTYELRSAIADFREEMASYIDERFELFIQSLPDYEKLIVHNPVRGYDTTVQVALDDLYASFNVFGLTAREFDSLGLTCAEFDAKGLTAHEFDSLGYKLLNYPDPTYWMIDPFTGEWSLVSDVVMKLFALHALTVTAAFFDALELTCEEFDAKELTAFEFDFNGISA